MPRRCGCGRRSVRRGLLVRASFDDAREEGANARTALQVVADTPFGQCASDPDAPGGHPHNAEWPSGGVMALGSFAHTYRDDCRAHGAGGGAPQGQVNEAGLDVELPGFTGTSKLHTVTLVYRCANEVGSDDDPSKRCTPTRKVRLQIGFGRDAQTRTVELNAGQATVAVAINAEGGCTFAAPGDCGI